ncbi:MAG: ORF6N domain-containing protein [Bacteroidales bacterium]
MLSQWNYNSQNLYLIRDKKVMLDVYLAELYNVETRRLNEQVKRNISRLPFTNTSKPV